MLKKYPIFEISLTLIFLAVVVGGAFSDGVNFPLRWFERDDAYYYFKVAQNISEGRGSTFDGINLTNGYHPLWMVVCIPIFAFARYDLILPLRILFVVMGMLHLFTALYLYALLKRIVSVPVAMFCAGFWAFDTLIDSSIYQQGLETGLAAFFIVLLIYTLARKEEKWEHEPANRKDIIALAVLAALVMFSRLDLVFLAVLVGLRIVFRRTTLKDLLAIDLLFIAASVLISFLVRLDLPQYYNYSNAAIVMVGVTLLVRIPVLYFFGLYENNSQRSMVEIIRRSFLVIALGSLIITPLMLVASSLLGFDGFPRMVLVYDLVIAFLYTVFSRLAAYWFSNKRSSQTPLEFMQKIGNAGWLMGRCIMALFLDLCSFICSLTT